MSCLFLDCIRNTHVMMTSVFPLSVLQGLCLRGERQKHAGAQVPRVQMWYPRRSHRYKSSRNLLQGGCHHCRRLHLSESICSETSNHALIRELVLKSEREKAFHWCSVWGWSFNDTRTVHDCCTKLMQNSDLTRFLLSFSGEVRVGERGFKSLHWEDRR